MFSNEEKEKVDNFISYLDSFEEDRKKRIESLKRIDSLLGTNSFEETTKWKVEGKDEVQDRR